MSIETDPAVTYSHPFLTSSPPINPKGTQEITRRMKLGHTNVPGGKGVDVPGTLFIFRGRTQNHPFMGDKSRAQKQIPRCTNCVRPTAGNDVSCTASGFCPHFRFRAGPKRSHLPTRQMIQKP